MKKNIFRIRNIKDIDISSIDANSFREGLLSSISRTAINCERIDKEIDFLTHTPYIPGVNALEHYSAIVDLIVMKDKLIKIYKLHTDWYKTLPERGKQLYQAYFVNKDNSMCRQISKTNEYYERIIVPMINRFTGYVKTIGGLTMKELIENPFIHESYLYTLTRKEKRQQQEQEKGEGKYDGTGDENCHI